MLAGGCFVGWLLTARGLYFRWRGRQTGHRDCSSHGTKDARKAHPGLTCCYDYTAVSDGQTAVIAMVAGLLFPLVILAVLVRWQPQRRKRLLSAAELAALEQANGIGVEEAAR